MKKKVFLTDEQKAHCAKEVAEGLSYQEASIKYNVSQTTVRKIVGNASIDSSNNDFIDSQIDVLIDSQIDKRESFIKINRLENENKALRNALLALLAPN